MRLHPKCGCPFQQYQSSSSKWKNHWKTFLSVGRMPLIGWLTRRRHGFVMKRQHYVRRILSIVVIGRTPRALTESLARMTSPALLRVSPGFQSSGCLKRRLQSSFISRTVSMSVLLDRTEPSQHLPKQSEGRALDCQTRSVQSAPFSS